MQVKKTSIQISMNHYITKPSKTLYDVMIYELTKACEVFPGLKFLWHYISIASKLYGNFLRIF